MILLNLSYNSNTTLFTVASTVFYYMVESDGEYVHVIRVEYVQVIVTRSFVTSNSRVCICN